MLDDKQPVPAAGVDLYWLPLGAGDSARCVRASGRLFESFAARREHRRSCDLYHAALAVRGDGRRFVIEMRRWREGVIPDVAAAADSPRRLSDDPVLAQRILDPTPAFPVATWGRELPVGG